MNSHQFYLAILCLVAASLINGDSLPKQLFKGDITYYYEWRGNYGSCALNKSLSDPYQVAALSRHWMKLPKNITNPNNHPLCEEQHCVKINGKRSSVVLKVSDTCYGCRPYDVDIADKIYPLLDDPRKGRIKMTWRFIDCKFLEN
ncbi:unnamed protein product [Chironomus riparius]|uniref:RlpA-like protein double-psi beta-barrel domain-containing protein n=1 Tax=Chironomus riparius TaxID=315576 RepID=A0A9N9RWL6_9DIPT|nr:unnamed protein product [Chironomus riparius]